MYKVTARSSDPQRETAVGARRGAFTGFGANERGRWRAGIAATILAVVFAVNSVSAGQSLWRLRSQPPEALSAAEFSRLVREISEDGGFFRSDNFTSNETSYLHIVGKLRELGATGGAYIGVGPEQNFTYIAKVRPRIAFIIDIRRQAIIQHLMFKAIFHLAPSRAEYLSLLLSRPLPKDKPLSSDASVADMISFFTKTPADERAYTSNIAAIRKAIKDDFQVPLSDTDQSSLDYVYKNFRDDGLEISYRMEGSRGGWFPSLKELIEQPDQHGKLGNFLASKEDYEFVRDLHRKNLVIPVVGDFAGKKALASIGDYLRKAGINVSAFYTSNVEQYLFQNGVFTGFAENVRKLPINEKSVFIRAVPNTRFTHPAQLAGHRITTLLQQLTIFLKDFDEGRYQSYSDLVLTHYIAPEAPK
ncbi:MAG TPA: hypothetical protein VFF31_00610 [Blastocatellia bacterium]|nr:hypothetical protein [Blastocatellia bacterium]